MKLANAAIAAVIAMTFAIAVGQSTSGYARGIDVSYWQGTIDWSKVAASGVSFAFVRVSDGAHYNDPEFARNWSEAKKHGLVRGAYQFFRPTQDALAQANLVVAKVKLEPGDLPPVCDVEVMDGVTAATLAAQVKLWCDHVKQKTGVAPIIYTSPGFWNALSHRPPLAGIPVWVAHWNVSAPRVPLGWTEWSFWQHTDKATIPGIKGGVDANYFRGSVAELEAFAAARGVPGKNTVVSGSTVARPILRQGATGPDVVALQSLLAKHGFDGGTSGTFDAKTRDAVIAFQKSRQLVPDAIVGPLTWGELQRS